MSHFAVLVISDDHEAALAPFQENNMGDCPSEYMVFTDCEDEYRTQYENDSTERVVMPDGRLLSRWDDEFRKPGSFGLSIGAGHSSHEPPAHLPLREVPFKELYATFEQYMADYCGYEGRDPQKGRYGSWENPNRKWDWYQVGGRWSGKLKLKPGANGLTGDPGLMGSRFAEGNRTDQARKGDIDWIGMRDEEGAKAKERWEHAQAITGGEKWHAWEHVREVLHKGDIEAAREAYHEQPAVKRLKQADQERYGWELDDALCWSLDNYVQRSRNAAGSTFALLKDGKWYERGEMGWWGCVGNKKNTDDWHQEFAKLLDSLPDDTLLTVVDCHI